MIRIAVLGSTGSIGTQTLDVAKRHPERLQVVGLTADTSGDLLKKQVAEFNARAALSNPKAADQHDLEGGPPAIEALVQSDDVDLVVVAVAGVAGLGPTIAAINAGKRIALASKEVLVAAGEVVMPLVRERGVTLTPIDSEHSAVFQCLQAAQRDDLKRVILTASGGPFRGHTREDLKGVTASQALNHPTWSMGAKITVDSATLFNKALEVIEARWLFDLPHGRVEVVVHPQSVIHSMVEMADSSVLAQLGWPDMRLPIQYALLYPERVEGGLEPWNPIATPSLTFEPVDHETFPAITLARHALDQGGTTPCAFNAANERAANAFLQGQCEFLQIYALVEETMARHESRQADLEAIIETDRWARETVDSILRL